MYLLNFLNVSWTAPHRKRLFVLMVVYTKKDIRILCFEYSWKKPHKYRWWWWLWWCRREFSSKTYPKRIKWYDMVGDGIFVCSYIYILLGVCCNKIHLLEWPLYFPFLACSSLLPSVDNFNCQFYTFWSSLDHTFCFFPM